MNLTRGHYILFAVSTLYILCFSAYFLLQRDYEFILYLLVLFLVAGLVLGTLKHTRFSLMVLWGLSIWGLLHVAGGSLVVGDTVLYGLQLIDFVSAGEFSILKYDQFVHAFGFGVATLVAYELLKTRWQPHASIGLLCFLAATVGMGLGSVNEVVEFIAVLSVPETGVGGYYNTALDLVANLFGAGSVAIVLYIREKVRVAI